jgi:hypothetical protein
LVQYPALDVPRSLLEISVCGPSARLNPGITSVRWSFGFGNICVRFRKYRIDLTIPASSASQLKNPITGEVSFLRITDALIRDSCIKKP